jgi:sulfide:quinone oxidoreductase
VTSADILIVGGGAAGLAVASSLLARKSDLDIVIIDPAETHYYQPGWTLVGAGVFTAQQTAKPEAQQTCVDFERTRAASGLLERHAQGQRVVCKT